MQLHLARPPQSDIHLSPWVPRIYRTFQRNPSLQKFINVLAITALAFVLTACGDKNKAATAVTAPVVATAPVGAPVADNALGMSVFSKTCWLCHATGVGGAPKTFDKADWGPRIAQGRDVLYKHALEGFTGAKGVMPPRGTGTALSDDEIKAAVNYMVDKSR